MPHILVHGQVKDFAGWKATFDGNAETRTNAGSKGGGFVFQSPDDPNEIVILLEWDDVQRAKDFVASAQLKEIMEKAGFVGEPHMHVLDLVDRPSA